MWWQQVETTYPEVKWKGLFQSSVGYVIAFTVFCGTLSRDFLVFVIVNMQLSSCALGHKSEHCWPKYRLRKFKFSCFLSWRCSLDNLVEFYTVWPNLFVGRFREKMLTIFVLGWYILSIWFWVFLKYFLGALKRASYTTWKSDIQSARYKFFSFYHFAAILVDFAHNSYIQGQASTWTELSVWRWRQQFVRNAEKSIQLRPRGCA